ncbi:MAG: hypothetical protein A3F13_09915 [Gammaproteobacteria bacterium RIFCSPHIGHO2_12_FULL_40_19]|nr:MAG: hypothetical protein A3F13_09915 [Gammaproteobacteria bacterium RIFCSPHIGHO2_12_FULL_40_19]
MAAMELLCHLTGINLSKLSKEEILLLEAEFFARICEELKEVFRKQHRDYFLLMKLTVEKENMMLETNFVRFIIKDILSTEEYNLQGVACYMDTHEDVVQEVIDGRNTSPSATLLRRSIDLHRSVRRELYHSIMKKISTA